MSSCCDEVRSERPLVPISDVVLYRRKEFEFSHLKRKRGHLAEITKILKSLDVHLLDLPIRVVEVCDCNCRPGDRVPRLSGFVSFAIAFHSQLARASQKSENPALHFRKKNNFTNDNLLRHDKVQPDTQVLYRRQRK